jgi:hypothetical protein
MDLEQSRVNPKPRSHLNQSGLSIPTNQKKEEATLQKERKKTKQVH